MMMVNSEDVGRSTPQNDKRDAWEGLLTAANKGFVAVTPHDKEAWKTAAHHLATVRYPGYALMDGSSVDTVIAFIMLIPDDPNMLRVSFKEDNCLLLDTKTDASEPIPMRLMLGSVAPLGTDVVFNVGKMVNLMKHPDEFVKLPGTAENESNPILIHATDVEAGSQQTVPDTLLEMQIKVWCPSPQRTFGSALKQFNPGELLKFNNPHVWRGYCDDGPCEDVVDGPRVKFDGAEAEVSGAPSAGPVKCMISRDPKTLVESTPYIKLAFRPTFSSKIHLMKIERVRSEGRVNLLPDGTKLWCEHVSVDIDHGRVVDAMMRFTCNCPGGFKSAKWFVTLDRMETAFYQVLIKKKTGRAEKQ